MKEVIVKMRNLFLAIPIMVGMGGVGLFFILLGFTFIPVIGIFLGLTFIYLGFSIGISLLQEPVKNLVSEEITRGIDATPGIEQKPAEVHVPPHMVPSAI
jgi:hypothetical protein